MVGIFFGFLVLTAVTAATGTQQYVKNSFISILENINKEEHFENVFILKNSKLPFAGEFGENPIKDISVTLCVPIVLATELNSFPIKKQLSSKLLVIIYLNSTLDNTMLQLLLKNSNRMRFCKMIFLLNYPLKYEELKLKEVFNFCWENHITNVLTIFRDFNTTSVIYRYNNFPTFKIEVINWRDPFPVDRYFPNRMRDLKGYPLPVIFGGSEPKMILSKNENGETIIAGYAGHLFQALAKKTNASLRSPAISKTISAADLTELVKNGSYDISAATTLPHIPMDWFSYPYETIDWCLMLPIEPKIPIHAIFLMIFRLETLLLTIGIILVLSILLGSASYLSGRETSLLNYFINDSCLRGALGQSFLEIPNASFNIKFIYVLICLIGIILVTSYNAFLQTYITSPPTEKKIESFDDLLVSEVKVFSLKAEFDALLNTTSYFKYKYLNMFVIENDFESYLKFRDSLNTKYSYMVNTVKWIIVQEQQNIFTRPLFRKPKGTCFFKGLLMSFPINENSIYMDILNFVILEVHASGLLEFWQRKSFNELIEAGKLKLVDLTSKPEAVPLKIEDLQLVWIGMGIASIAATLCFCFEILCYKLKSHLDVKKIVL